MSDLRRAALFDAIRNAQIDEDDLPPRDTDAPVQSPEEIEAAHAAAWQKLQSQPADYAAVMQNFQPDPEAQAYADEDGPPDDEDEPEAAPEAAPMQRSRDPFSSQIAALRNRLQMTRDPYARDDLEVQIQALMRQRAQSERR